MTKAVGNRIRELREEFGITREELAEDTELSVKFLYEIEKGRKGISAVTLLKIAKRFSCSCDYIMTGEKRDWERAGRILQMLESMDAEKAEKVEGIIKLIWEISER